MSARRWATLLAGLLAAVLMITLEASPAMAGTKTKVVARPNATVTFAIHADRTAGVYGDISYRSTSTSLHATKMTVFVVQCDGLGHNCGTISAASSSGANYIRTSTKPYSFGHTWKTCGSVDDNDGLHLVNVCTALTT